MKYDWIKETNWQENLEGNLKIMVDTVGIDLFIKLFETFSKSYLYFTDKEFKILQEQKHNQENLKGDLKILVGIIGVDLLIKLFETFSKSFIYFSEKELFKLRREFVLKYKNLGSRIIANSINASERFVFKTLQEHKENESTKNIITTPEPEEYLELDLSIR